MSKTKKTISLGKIKQLIDLNDDSTNFNLSFNVSCHDNTPFEILVVDQTTLDNSPELEYKKVSGSINGTIVADKNVYQNYFLILKSETPCKVDIEFTKNVLPVPTMKVPHKEQYIPVESSNKMQFNVSEQSVSWLKIGLIALVVIGGVLILWWLYNRNNNKKDSSTDDDIIDKLDEHSHSLDNAPIDNIYNKSATPEQSIHSTPSHHCSSATEHDSRGYRPAMYKSSVSPDLMSRQSSGGEDGGNSLLYRLKKFAR